VGNAHYRVAGRNPLAPGKHTVRVDFTFDGGGMGQGGAAQLSVDGNAVAQGRIGHTIPVRISLDESLDIGEDTGTPLDESYDVPFRFPGKIEKVTIDLK
jgi:arylsulfatase